MMGALLVAALLLRAASGLPAVQGRADLAEVVFRGLPSSEGRGLFWLLDVYKGGGLLAQLLGLPPAGGHGLRDRLVNVSRLDAALQGQHIVYCGVDGGGLAAQRAEQWTQEREDAVWASVGWQPWSDWSACSASCGEGSQQRRRYCRLEACSGYNKEARDCNMFPCQRAASPLDLQDRRFFHPSRSHWERVPGRSTAWRLRPNSYIWVPSTELFPPPAHFPKEFSLLVTLRLHPQERAQGTLFSLRSRRRQDSYLSLELDSSGAVRLMHSGPNGSQALDVGASLGDGRWHQLAIGLHGDSSVRSYLDCVWVSTDILKRNSLDTPDDADVVIGYLFMGDLEQLVVVPDPAAVSQQCSSSRVPLVDPALVATGNTSAARRRSKPRKGVDFRHGGSEVLAGAAAQDRDLYEGSGSQDAQYEVEWSEWSDCSASCGPGAQTRYSRCVDDGGRLELCMEAGGETTESRACSRGACPRRDAAPKARRQRLYQTVLTANDTVLNVSALDAWKQRGKLQGWRRCSCLHGGSCRTEGGSCQCPAGYSGHRCERVTCEPSCLHGGTCEHPGTCLCPPQYSGPRCELPVCAGGCLHGGSCVAPGLCACGGGYRGRRCEASSCALPCQHGGRCAGPGLCSCPSGWAGPDCSAPVCEPPCRHGGQCGGPQVCRCPRGTSGAYCQTFSCKYPCVNGGACVGPDQCECPRNATGPTCATPVCDPPCENGATCGAGNTCACAPGSSGTRCEKRKCAYRPYQEPYTRGFRRLVTRKTESRCDPWGLKTCVRSQPEYQTVYKTFYRTVYKCSTGPGL